MTTHMRYGHSETWPTLWRRRVHTISLKSVDLTLAGSGLWETTTIIKNAHWPSCVKLISCARSFWSKNLRMRIDNVPIWEGKSILQDHWSTECKSKYYLWELEGWRHSHQQHEALFANYQDTPEPRKELVFQFRSIKTSRLLGGPIVYALTYLNFDWGICCSNRMPKSPLDFVTLSWASAHFFPAEINKENIYNTRFSSISPNYSLY